MTRPGEDVVLDPHLDPLERDPEAPPADAVEQAAPARPADEPGEVSRGWEVGEWDAFEQSIVIDIDDEYER